MMRQIELESFFAGCLAFQKLEARKNSTPKHLIELHSILTVELCSKELFH